MKTVKFNNFNGKIEFGTYSNGRTAMTLIDVEDGLPIATCTVNVPDAPQTPFEVFIKNWSENKGMVDALVEAGVIEPTHRKFGSGFVEVDVCAIK